MPTARKRHDGGLAVCGLALGLPWLAGQGVAPAYGAEWSTCKYFSQLPDDCAGAEQRKYDNLRNYRYQEIELFAKDALKKILYVSVYNTTGQNDADETRDSAPKPLSDSTQTSQRSRPAGVATPKTGPEEDRQAIPGARRSDEPSPLLDSGLARRPGRRRAEF